jgi:F-type H+-transporting ATPase subunit b
MRGARLALAILLPLVLFSAAAPTAAAEPEHGSAGSESASHGNNTTLWKWVNFGILAGGLGYFGGKKGGSFFRSRTRDIQQAIAEATRLRQEAEARLAEMEQRLTQMDGAVAELRAAASAESAAEAERIRRETEAQLAKVQANAEAEIAAAAKSARQELKAYTVELAVRLAEERVRRQLRAEDDSALVESFARELGENARRSG